MQLAPILLLAVCVVLLETGSNVQAVHPGGGGGGIIGPGGGGIIGPGGGGFIGPGGGGIIGPGGGGIIGPGGGGIIGPGGGGIIGPGRRNLCWRIRCGPGMRCIQRRWRAVCIPFRRFRRACFQPVRVGRCRAAIRRFFYNRFTGRCQRFIYGGCGGNLNNFYSWRQCQRRCVWRRHRPIRPINPIWPISPILFSSDQSTSDDS